MNVFGKEPQEQAMQTLLHDINRATSNTNHQLSKLADWLRNHEEMLDVRSRTDILTCRQYLVSCNKSVEKTLDNYYTKFKNDFK